MTPLQIFLHPRRAARRLAFCEAELQELNGLREKLQREAELDKAAMQGTLAGAEAERTRLAAKVAELELRLHEETARGDEQQLEIEEITRQVERVGEVIDKYRQRLKAMQRRLTDARMELREAHARIDGEILPVISLQSTSGLPQESEKPAPPAPEGEFADWYVTPPEL